MVMTWLEDEFGPAERTPATKLTRRKKNAMNRLVREGDDVWRVVVAVSGGTAGNRGMGW